MPTIDDRPTGGHPTDGELRAHLDREADGAAHSIAAHLAACTACQGRLARLAEDYRVAETLLANLDHPMPVQPARVVPAPRRAAPRHWLRIAAAVALTTLGISGIAAALPGGPLHRLWARVVAAVAPRQAPKLQAAPAPVPDRSAIAAAPGTVGVAFDPVRELVIRLPEADRPGAVRIALTDRSTAAIRVQDGTVAFALVGDTVDVAPHDGAHHYLVTVPRQLARFEIQVGSRLRYAAQWDARRGVYVPADTLIILSTESQGNP